MQTTHRLAGKPYTGIRVRLFQLSVSIILISVVVYYYYTTCNPFTNGIYWKAMGLIPPATLIAFIIVSNPNILTGKHRVSGYSKDPPIAFVTTLFFIFSALIVVRTLVDSDICAFQIAAECILHGFIISSVLLLIIIVNSTTNYLNDIDMK